MSFILNLDRERKIPGNGNTSSMTVIESQSLMLLSYHAGWLFASRSAPPWLSGNRCPDPSHVSTGNAVKRYFARLSFCAPVTTGLGLIMIPHATKGHVICMISLWRVFLLVYITTNKLWLHQLNPATLKCTAGSDCLPLTMDLQLMWKHIFKKGRNV